MFSSIDYLIFVEQLWEITFDLFKEGLQYYTTVYFMA